MLGIAQGLNNKTSPPYRKSSLTLIRSWMLRLNKSVGQCLGETGKSFPYGKFSAPAFDAKKFDTNKLDK